MGILSYSISFFHFWKVSWLSPSVLYNNSYRNKGDSNCVLQLSHHLCSIKNGVHIGIHYFNEKN